MSFDQNNPSSFIPNYANILIYLQSFYTLIQTFKSLSVLLYFPLCFLYVLRICHYRFSWVGRWLYRNHRFPKHLYVRCILWFGSEWGQCFSSFLNIDTNWGYKVSMAVLLLCFYHSWGHELQFLHNFIYYQFQETCHKHRQNTQ